MKRQCLVNLFLSSINRTYGVKIAFITTKKQDFNWNSRTGGSSNRNAADPDEHTVRRRSRACAVQPPTTHSLSSRTAHRSLTCTSHIILCSVSVSGTRERSEKCRLAQCTTAPEETSLCVSVCHGAHTLAPLAPFHSTFSPKC